MKEVSVNIKVNDNFKCGDCQHCRFSDDMKYSNHFDRWLYKCILRGGREFVMDKESCPIVIK